MIKLNIVKYLKQQYYFADKLNWTSFDPFDILLSPYLKDVQSNSLLASRILIQIGKRSGQDIRKMLKIKPHQEAKTISDYLSASVILVQNKEIWALDYIKPLIIKIMKKSIVTSNGLGWGLQFPYVSRFVNVPINTPNAYTTANAINSLLDVYELFGREEDKLSAWLGCCFLIKDLGVFNYKNKTWIKYWPNKTIPIVNVQALMASVLSRANKYFNNRKLEKLADQCAETVIIYQKKDGSWKYSEDNKANFIDGFHTGFVLQGLAEYNKYKDNKINKDIYKAIKIGFDYFKNHLITKDAMPRYYADGRISNDGQNFAQCIQTICICKENKDDLNLAIRLWKNNNKLTKLKKSFLIKERTKSLFNIYPDFRWSLGPMVLASVNLLRTLKDNK
jgi:hypothetical protein